MIFVISSQHNLPLSNHEVLLVSTLAARPTASIARSVSVLLQRMSPDDEPIF